ncbi:hypothetical protein I7I48_04128 [Histoplasma ohiense]|nr:hypothetical protein I7I48_04128 [Histoplasma ohiense (nom. inval.)]
MRLSPYCDAANPLISNICTVHTNCNRGYYNRSNIEQGPPVYMDDITFRIYVQYAKLSHRRWRPSCCW